MPSPFPGMNPYLEKLEMWSDFHDRFLVHAAEALTAQARPHFIISIAEHLFVQDPDGGDGDEFIGDVSASLGQDPPSGAALATIPAPVRVRLPDAEPDRLTYLEVRDRQNQRVVAVIELLSPTNKKAGRDRRQFVRKRNEFLASDLVYVELDLLRGWSRMPLIGLPECAYYAMVSRPLERPEAGIWPIQLRERLPKIPIPLIEDAKEPVIDIQELVHKIYDSAGYEDFIYRHDPEPPLSPVDAAWAKEIIAAVWK
jgi:hypothetical protein